MVLRVGGGGADEVRAKVTESGKLNIPARQRRLVGLDQGGPVMIRVEDGELRIHTVRDTMQALQDWAARLLPGVTVDAFLAERRDEARREGE